jgi:hypothetical protein
MGIKARWRKHICAICAPKSARLHALGADHAHHIGRGHESNEGACCPALPATGSETRRVDDDVLQFARQWAYQFSALDRENGNNLLHADLGLALGDDLGHRAAGQPSLRLHLVGNAEADQQICDIGAARTVAVADRSRPLQRLSERRNGADVGLRRAGADRKAHRRARDVGLRAGSDLAGLGQRIELRPRQERNVERGAVLDLFFQHRRQREFDLDLGAVRPLEQRHDFGHERFHGAAAKNFNFHHIVQNTVYQEFRCCKNFRIRFATERWREI